MLNASQTALKLLKDKGYRITRARQLIIESIAGTNSALTIQAIAEKVAADEASVYRTLAVLRQENLVEEIAARGQKTKYALRHGHHHHVVCRQCGWLQKVDCNAALVKPKSIQGFAKIEDHDVTFYGLCSKCV